VGGEPNVKSEGGSVSWSAVESVMKLNSLSWSLDSVKGSSVKSNAVMNEDDKDRNRLNSNRAIVRE
jgi:hypothetical protein